MKDGGQAFPRPYSQFDVDRPATEFYSEQEGMTLRDWFAGQALAGYWRAANWASSKRANPSNAP